MARYLVIDCTHTIFGLSSYDNSESTRNAWAAMQIGL